jgi:extradiol dioxygenase family protein
MLKLRHYTVAVHDLDSAVEHYKERFGMEAIGERRHNDIGNFDFVSMGYAGEMLMQLIEPSADDTPLQRLMRDRVNEFNPHGEGIYIMGFETEDPAAFAEQVESGGGRITRIPNSSNVFVHPMSSNFVLMEIFPTRPA